MIIPAYAVAHDYKLTVYDVLFLSWRKQKRPALLLPIIN